MIETARMATMIPEDRREGLESCATPMRDSFWNNAARTLGDVVNVVRCTSLLCDRPCTIRRGRSIEHAKGTLQPYLRREADRLSRCRFVEILLLSRPLAQIVRAGLGNKLVGRRPRALLPKWVQPVGEIGCLLGHKFTHESPYYYFHRPADSKRVPIGLYKVVVQQLRHALSDVCLPSLIEFYLPLSSLCC